MKNAPGYIAAFLIVGLALIPPVSINIHATVNTTPWLWIMLASGFLGLFFLNLKANIWIKFILIFCFITCFLSRAPYLSFTIYSSVVVAAYFYILCTKIKNYDIVFKVLQSVLLLFVILIVMQLFKTDTLLNFNRPEKVFLGTIGNVMMMGSLITCLSPFLISYRKLNIIPIFIIAIISGSRGSIFALLAGVLFYLFFKVKQKIVYFAVLLALLSGFFVYASKDNALTSFWSGGRGMIWKRTIELINKHPLAGWGIGTFKVIFPVLSSDLAVGNAPSWKYENTQGDWIAWRRTHNCWLQLAFEIGKIGFVLFLGLIGSLAWKFIKARKSEAIVVAMAGLIIVGTDMLLHFPTRMEQSIPSIICFLAFFEYVIANKGGSKKWEDLKAALALRQDGLRKRQLA